MWQSAAVKKLSLFSVWCRVVLHIHLTYLNNNSITLEDVSIIYTQILLLMWHLNTQQL